MLGSPYADRTPMSKIAICSVAQYTLAATSLPRCAYDPRLRGGRLFPTCCSHYPGGSNGCICRFLPRPRGLPHEEGGSASATSLSRPAQALLTLRPVGLLDRPGSCIRGAAFVTRLRSGQLPNRTARQLPDLSTPIRVEPSSTGHPCPRGTPPHPNPLPIAKNDGERGRAHPRVE